MSIERLLAWDKESVNHMGAFLGDQIRNCDSIDILTGYFYANGLEAITEAISEHRDKKLTLRILVGMDADISTRGLVYALYSREHKQFPTELIKDTLQKIEAQLTEADENYQLPYDVSKIEICVRRTKEKNHSKVYLLGGKSFTCGSSNLTKDGLSRRHECNVHVKDQALTREVQDKFEELWASSLPIDVFTDQTGDGEGTGPSEDSKDTTRPWTVFDAYMKIMHEYLKGKEPEAELSEKIKSIVTQATYFDKDGNEQPFTSYYYQTKGVADAYKILQQYGGVIIADVVGLGKTVMASALASMLDGPGMIIAPAHLLKGEDSWETYLGRKNGNDTSKPLGFALTPKGWSAHSMDESKLTDLREFKAARTLIIDEAHNFRNPNTALYDGMSAALNQSPKNIIFLSATPFNNSPKDLESLVKLFPAERIQSVRDTLTNHVGKYEKELIEWKSLRADKIAQLKKQETISDEMLKDLENSADKLQALGREIKNVVMPLIMRRNRIDLKETPEFWADIAGKMPVEMPPVNFSVRLDDSQIDFYNAILQKYFGGECQFAGTIYHPHDYTESKGDRDSERQNNLRDMIRRIVVARWESSPYAFQKTLDKLIQNHRTALEYLDKYGVLIGNASMIKQLKRKKNITEGEIEELGDSDSIESNTSTLTWEQLCDMLQKPGVETIYVTAGISLAHREQIDRLTQTDKQKKPTLVLNGKFLSDLKDDAALLEQIRREFKPADYCGVEKDKKLAKMLEVVAAIQENDDTFSKMIREQAFPENLKLDDTQETTSAANNPRKVIIFTSYADTAEYIASALDQQGRCRDKYLFFVGSTDAARKASREAIRAAFKHDEMDALSTDKMILVCTDVLSEGVNLNQARVVINYDLTYNPVRVIQRVGRINRIRGKAFDKIFKVNFFPTDKGEQETHVRDYAVHKMQMIHEIMGMDAQMISLDETPGKTQLVHAGSSCEADNDETKIRTLFEYGLLLECGANPQTRKEYQAAINQWPEFQGIVSANQQGMYLFLNKFGIPVHYIGLSDKDDNNHYSPKNCYQALQEMLGMADDKDMNQKKLFDTRTLLPMKPFLDSYEGILQGYTNQNITRALTEQEKKYGRLFAENEDQLDALFPGNSGIKKKILDYFINHSPKFVKQMIKDIKDGNKQSILDSLPKDFETKQAQKYEITFVATLVSPITAQEVKS
ncbi:helicase-related protein [Oligosphaera ethanolica]|uniref:Superfamily II DNA or RNA helicase/HKD family nuclease n=1 Tax=Oligosphaera ethanolica TaxID=760260 RepID=A0AAE3VH70_9BACT|nr:helicase-related protein [Oligosphaera ethanolica]MDQ0290432.1 superfamily II DNA or RNA helicase/HKD family nuclease [Oligosphaera ethanolica]